MNQQVVVTPNRIKNAKPWRGELIATNPHTDVTDQQSAKIEWPGAPASALDESAAGHIMLRPGFALVLPKERGEGWSKLPVHVPIHCVSVVGGANA